MIESLRISTPRVAFGARVLGDGPLVLLLHGFPDGPEGYDPILERLAGGGYRAVAAALPGYGSSSAPTDGDYALASLANTLLALTEALGAGPAAVIGNDWGASLAFLVAGLAPDRVRAVIALGQPHPAAVRLRPALLWHMRHFQLLGTPGLGAWAIRRRRHAYLRTLIERWSPGWAGAEALFTHARAAFEDPARLRAALSYYQAFTRWPWSAAGRRTMRGLRGALAVPLMTVRGSDDATFSASDYARGARHAPRHVHHDLPGGHFLHHEQPEAVADLTLDFLASVPTLRPPARKPG